MNEDLTFLTGVAISLISSAAVVAYLHRHLRTILRDLCGTEARADFWGAFSNVTLVLVPLICALVRTQEGPAPPVLVALASQVKWGLIGLVAAVMLLGFVLSWFILGTAISTGSGGRDGAGADSKGA